MTRNRRISTFPGTRITEAQPSQKRLSNPCIRLWFMNEAFMSGFFAELQRRKVYHVAAMRVSNPDRSPPAILSETLTECVDETKRQ